MNKPFENVGDIIIYQTEDGQTQVDVRMENDTVWLTQAQMAELFGKDQSVIARHIANVFKEGELEKESNMQILHNTLVALTLMIAESRTEEKDVMVKVVVNLINQRNL